MSENVVVTVKPGSRKGPLVEAAADGSLAIYVRERAIEGRATLLIHNGQVDRKALERESLTLAELVEVIHKQGFEDTHQVHRCELEPNGTFYVEGFDPSAADKHHVELMARLDALSREVAALRAQSAS